MMKAARILIWASLLMVAAAPSAAPRAAASAHAIPSGGRSRCVTARTDVGPMTLNRTPWELSVRAANWSPVKPVPPTSKITMFVSTRPASIAMPGTSASPAASSRARSWSSARRSTWCSSA